jgi:hypothetical protein
MNKILIILASFMLVSQSNAIEKKYQVTIISNWNVMDHVSVPGNAHFSPVVSVTHSGSYQLMSLGGLATAGLKELAETGRTGMVVREIQTAIQKDQVGELVVTQNQFVKDQLRQTFVITVTPQNPYFSFVTMIAPSPDWIIGLSKVRLFSKKTGFSTGTLQPQGLYAIDAGTESGDFGGNFSIVNEATIPQKRISFFSKTTQGFTAPFAYVTIVPL